MFRNSIRSRLEYCSGFFLVTQRSLSLPYLSRKIEGPLLVGYELTNNNLFKDRYFQRYLVLDVLTNPVSYTHEKGNILGKNPRQFRMFTYFSLKIKFAPFLKSKPATIPWKGRRIKWATKLLIKQDRPRKEESEKERSK